MGRSVLFYLLNALGADLQMEPNISKMYALGIIWFIVLFEMQNPSYFASRKYKWKPSNGAPIIIQQSEYKV